MKNKYQITVFWLKGQKESVFYSDYEPAFVNGFVKIVDTGGDLYLVTSTISQVFVSTISAKDYKPLTKDYGTRQ